MPHFDILLPFGLPPAEMAADLVRELKTPALATLITRTRSRRHQVFEHYACTLPHESWFAGQFGLMHSTDNSPALATAARQTYGLIDGKGVWFVLHPVHLHIARDHLVLTDQRQLALSDTESRSLFDAIAPLCAEAGKMLVYGDTHTWLLRADDWVGLETATPDATCGHNIDIWMPKGNGERQWRKLQNEIQMAWHTHPVNLERAERHLKVVNSVWLWGGADDPIVMPASPYQAVFNLSGWMGMLGHYAAINTKNGNVTDVIAATAERSLLVLDGLSAAALGCDWSEWLANVQLLENDWFAPLLAALRNGKIDSISLILSHGTALSEFTSTRSSLRQFWRKPSLAKLLP
jgi:hypothetical protein